MSIFTTGRRVFNRGIAPLNLKLDTLTATRNEDIRLRRLWEAGNFDKPIFPVPNCFASEEWRLIINESKKYAERFQSFRKPEANDVGYSFDNDYYTSPDAEILYTLTRMLEPPAILEVGSGNSTRIARQAIIDGGLRTKIISIDPMPRIEIQGFSNEILRRTVESIAVEDIVQRLCPNAILFIDSSHAVSTGNDVTFLFLRVLPYLPVGVIVHVHDIFLPYDYPKDWVLKEKYGWAEQYLVHGILQFGDSFEAIWPGHFLQRSISDFTTYFPEYRNVDARSLWLRKIK